MADMDGASWAHRSWNPWQGCDKVSPECAHCYAERLFAKQGRPWGKVSRTGRCWADPFEWQQMAAEGKVRECIFCPSMSDFFHPWADLFRDAAWKVIKQTPNLVYFLLSKYPARIMRCLPEDWGEGYRNVWFGTTVGCKHTLHRMDTLRQVPIHPDSIRGLSVEPLLEDIADELNLDGFQWVAVGGESGDGEEYLWDPNGDWRSELQTSGRRLMRLDWAAGIGDKVKAAGKAFMFKQVTAKYTGKGMNALGRVWREIPDPPLPLPWRKKSAIEPWHLWTEWQLRNLDEYGWPKGQKK